MKNYYFLYLAFLFLSISIIAQNKQEKNKIIKEYNINKLNILKEKYYQDSYKQKTKAILLAQKNGWKIKFTDSKGSYYELMKISEEGKPIYYKTSNVAAAVSTRANYLHNGGGLGLNIEGQGMIAHVWDGGLARETHQEYDGDGGENRFSIGDGTSMLNFHAAHVTGTIISSGVDPNAKGMAPKAKVIGYDWSNDEPEATAAAANGMLISNHSYGFAVRDDAGQPQLPAYYFGGYINDSRNWDNIMFNAPFYLMVVAAGNEGNDNSANSDPLEGNSSYDKLTGHSTAKNSLVVANGQDATINSDGSLSSVLRNSGSSEGPTDDLRIKPDIMGNGTGLYSTFQSSDDAYNTISGTSMASPNVAGTLLLLQQYYNEKEGVFMKASTIKGLALHTADDVAAIGPDAETGWGLLNGKKAAETITKKGLQSVISEIELIEGSTYTIVVNSDGLEPLIASISWTDLPGEVNTGTVNDPTPVLVNDIDIKVTKDSETFLPWKLTSLNSNDKGDNIVDPFERVDVQNASGEYTITISHKGSLVGGSQKVSLIVTGVSSGIALLTNTNTKTTCSNTETFDFNFIETIGGTTTFSIEGVPTNATSSLSSTSLSSDGVLTATFGNLDNVEPGIYSINVIGINGSETTITPIELRIIHSSFSSDAPLSVYPTNGSTGISTIGTEISWEKNNNAESYLVEVSTNPNFSPILFTENSNDLKFSVNALQSETVYYWRVKAENSCGSGVFSPVYSFQTGVSNCSNTYTATDFTMASIATTAGVMGYVPFSVTDDVTIDKILITTDIAHTYVQDIVVSLEGPQSIGGNKVVLLANPCDGTNDIRNTTFDDAADALSCSSTAPAISGTIAPINNMSLPFSGKNALGEWKLIVSDANNEDGGQINSASITFCTLSTNTNIPSLTHSDIIVDRNTTYTITSSNIEATTTGEASNKQIFTLVSVPVNGNLEKNGTVLLVGDTFNQKEVQGGQIKYVNTQTTSFIDEFVVDVTNGANGWLPNNKIQILETAALNIENNILEGVSFWPNPARNMFNVKLINTNNKKIKISLFDLQGRRILQTFDEPKNNTFTKEINLLNITSGIYLLSVEQGNKNVVKKMIISK